MDWVTGAWPGLPSLSPSMRSRWAESEAQVLRSERTYQLRHGSDRSEPAAPWPLRWRLSNLARKRPVWRTSPNPAGPVRLSRRRLLLCGRSDQADGAEQPAPC